MKVLCWLILLPVQLIAQIQGSRDEIRFARHLLQIDDPVSALKVLAPLREEHSMHLEATYWTAVAHFRNSDYIKAAEVAGTIDHLSDEAYLLQGLALAFARNPGAVSALSGRHALFEEKHEKLRRFLLAGLLLSENNGGFVREDSTLAAPLVSYFNEGVKMPDLPGRNKSPVLAGVFSALIPGLGKLYTGARGEALSSFLITSGTGAIAAEVALKTSLLSAPTLAVGTAFIILYAANIAGSYYKVIAQKNHAREVRTAHLLDLMYKAMPGSIRFQ